MNGNACLAQEVPISPDRPPNPHHYLTPQSSIETSSIRDAGTLEVPVVIERQCTLQRGFGDPDDMSPGGWSPVCPSTDSEQSYGTRDDGAASADQTLNNKNSESSASDSTVSLGSQINKNGGAMCNSLVDYSRSQHNGNDNVVFENDIDNPMSSKNVIQQAARRLEEVVRLQSAEGGASVLSQTSDGVAARPAGCIDDALQDLLFIDGAVPQESSQPPTASGCSSGSDLDLSSQYTDQASLLACQDPPAEDPPSNSPSASPKLKPSKSKLSKKRHFRGASFDFLLRRDRSQEDPAPVPPASVPSSPLLGQHRTAEARRGSLELKRYAMLCDSSHTGPTDTLQSASLPTSPVRRIMAASQKRAHSKHDFCSRLKSPLSRRRFKNHKSVDSSDDEVLLNGEEITTCQNYRNLETFQKAQLSKKVRSKTFSCLNGYAYHNWIIQMKKTITKLIK